MQNINLLSLALSAILTTGCLSSTEFQPEPVNGRERIPPDFQLNYYEGNGNFFIPLAATRYLVESNGKVTVTFLYPKKEVSEERLLSTEQLETLWTQVSETHLSNFAEPATELRDKCNKRETDQPARVIELRFNGKVIKVVDDFDPKRCVEVEPLDALTNNLPHLLEGVLLKSLEQDRPREK
ncbi:MAG TPA: hypothetical protein PLP21_13040 [Pyrinomonadaceae bacterium]|nr:hypothetical protein [Pyrinomonadaceae bacterium]